MTSKKGFLTVLLAIMSCGLFAQKLDRAKDYLKDKKLVQAKDEINKYLDANEKNQSNSEGWYEKSKIYIALSQDSTMKDSADAYRKTAFDAIRQYADIESKEPKPDKQYILLKLEGHAPLVQLYSGYSNTAATYYNTGNYKDALTNFQNCLKVFDFMSSHEWTNYKLDTNTTLYAGISAEKAKDLDQAAEYYGKLAENKVTGEGFVEIYKWLADHYKRKAEDEKDKNDSTAANKDFAEARKYLALGKEVYPKDDFWPDFDLELTRESGTQQDLFNKYEEMIKDHPDNNIYLFNYGVELYQAGYKPDTAERPANSKELIEKAKEVLQKCIDMKSDYPNAQMVMGQIFYNEGVDINAQMKAIKPTSTKKLTADELKQKNDLRADAIKKFDLAIPYFQKVDTLLGPQGKLKSAEREILRNAYDLLVTIYQQKGDKDKELAYTNKYNDVDKIH